MVAAWLRPSGTMKAMLASCRAIWCAASCAVPIRPMNRVEVANRPVSMTTAPPIGKPTR